MGEDEQIFEIVYACSQRLKDAADVVENGSLTSNKLIQLLDCGDATDKNELKEAFINKKLNSQQLLEILDQSEAEITSQTPAVGRFLYTAFAYNYAYYPEQHLVVELETISTLRKVVVEVGLRDEQKQLEQAAEEVDQRALKDNSASRIIDRAAAPYLEQTISYSFELLVEYALSLIEISNKSNKPISLAELENALNPILKVIGISKEELKRIGEDRALYKHKLAEYIQRNSDKEGRIEIDKALEQHYRVSSGLGGVVNGVLRDTVPVIAFKQSMKDSEASLRLLHSSIGSLSFLRMQAKKIKYDFDQPLHYMSPITMRIILDKLGVSKFIIKSFGVIHKRQSNQLKKTREFLQQLDSHDIRIDDKAEKTTTYYFDTSIERRPDFSHKIQLYHEKQAQVFAEICGRQLQISDLLLELINTETCDNPKLLRHIQRIRELRDGIVGKERDGVIIYDPALHAKLQKAINSLVNASFIDIPYRYTLVLAKVASLQDSLDREYNNRMLRQNLVKNSSLYSYGDDQQDVSLVTQARNAATTSAMAKFEAASFSFAHETAENVAMFISSEDTMDIKKQLEEMRALDKSLLLDKSGNKQILYVGNKYGGYSALRKFTINLFAYLDSFIGIHRRYDAIKTRADIKLKNPFSTYRQYKARKATELVIILQLKQQQEVIHKVLQMADSFGQDIFKFAVDECCKKVFSEGLILTDIARLHFNLKAIAFAINTIQDPLLRQQLKEKYDVETFMSTNPTEKDMNKFVRKAIHEMTLYPEQIRFDGFFIKAKDDIEVNIIAKLDDNSLTSSGVAAKASMASLLSYPRVIEAIKNFVLLQPIIRDFVHGFTKFFKVISNSAMLYADAEKLMNKRLRMPENILMDITYDKLGLNEDFRQADWLIEHLREDGGLKKQVKTPTVTQHTTMWQAARNMVSTSCVGLVGAVTSAFSKSSIYSHGNENPYNRKQTQFVASMEEKLAEQTFELLATTRDFISRSSNHDELAYISQELDSMIEKLHSKPALANPEYRNLLVADALDLLIKVHGDPCVQHDIQAFNFTLLLYQATANVKIISNLVAVLGEYMKAHNMRDCSNDDSNFIAKLCASTGLTDMLNKQSAVTYSATSITTLQKAMMQMDHSIEFEYKAQKVDSAKDAHNQNSRIRMT